jgi:hypothetical protein
MELTMTNQPPANRPPRRGRHWVVAAVTTPLAPLLLGASLLANNGWHGCATGAGAHPACSSSIWTALATLGFWAVALASTVGGLVVGLVEGRTRRRFAHGQWLSMTVVGLCAPWALAAYAAGYGLGRLLPARRPRPLRQPRRSAGSGGWQQAVQLYQKLAAGQQPPAVYAPDLPAAGTVYMDVPFRFARWFGANVTYQPGGMVAVGPPGFVAGAAVGRLIGTSIGYAQAASLSRRQWRGHDLARVVVDATATWCQVRGRWLRYDHTAVVAYQVADQSSVLTFKAIDPLRLSGPSAWCHAVLFAYLRYGAAWQSAPFLHPVREAATQMATVPR